MTKYYISLAVLFLLLNACQKQEPKDIPTVEVRQEDGKYVLYRHGAPYYIKGAAGYGQLEKIALYGGNSIRIWNTQDAERTLDEAACYGLTVTLGLEVGKEWWGEDFNYWDAKAVDQKIADLKKVVERYKDHPALLMWGVGNEVHLFGGNHLLVLHTIDRIARMIHEVDPNHPVMTTVPLGDNFDKRGIMRFLCPNVDILGVNGFYRLPYLYEEIRGTFGWNKAYILTELGAAGPWEMRSTNWGAPIEPGSTKKAELIENYLNLSQQDSSMCLGSYAFYWGKKYERTHTFMSLFPQEGYETESVNVFRSKWAEGYEGNQAPRIDSLIIHSVPSQDNQYLIADSLYQATVFSHDLDQDSLTYIWELRPEGKGLFVIGDFNYNMQHLLKQENCATIQFRTPEQEGGYRLFAFVFDEHQHVATHNIPFYAIMQ